MKTLDVAFTNLFALPRPSSVNGRVLAATVAESIAVPAGARFVILCGNVDFWVDFEKTAVVLAADTDVEAAPILIPGGSKELRMLERATTMSVVSTYACLVTAEFYK